MLLGEMDNRIDDAAEGGIVERLVSEEFQLFRVLDNKCDDLLMVQEHPTSRGGACRPIRSGANLLPSKSSLALSDGDSFANRGIGGSQEFSDKIAACLLR